MKTCSRCKTDRPENEFGNRKAAPDGLHPYCKPCSTAYSRAKYAEAPAKVNASNKVYREANAERIKAAKRFNYEKTREAVQAKNRDYYQRNRERLLDAQREYLKANKDKRKQYEQENRHIYAAKSARRRAREASQAIRLTQAQQDAIKHIYAFAKYLSKKFNKSYHVDHIVPLKGENVSGLHVPWNLQVLPAAKNLSKSNKH